MNTVHFTLYTMTMLVYSVHELHIIQFLYPFPPHHKIKVFQLEGVFSENTKKEAPPLEIFTFKFYTFWTLKKILTILKPFVTNALIF